MRVNDNAHGVQRMAQALDDLSAALTSEANRARLDAVTAETTEELRAVMPVRTGRLKASGDWSSDISPDEYVGTISFGGALAPYGPFVVGAYVNGEHPWDAVWARQESRFGDAIDGLWDSAIGR